MAKEQNIIYPIFNRYKAFTLDGYWIEIFNSCSLNKFPKGMKYSDNTIYIKTEKYAQSYKIPRDDIAAFNLLMKIFREDLLLRSGRDNLLDKEQINYMIEKRQLQLKVEDWKKLKPKTLKSHLLLTYVSKIKDENSLSIKEMKQLLSLIETAVQFKHISSSDIILEEGEIKEIKKIKFDSNSRIFKVKEKAVGIKKLKTETVKVQDKLMQNTDKYIREVIKKQI
jgi:hypothetical protein